MCTMISGPYLRWYFIYSTNRRETKPYFLLFIFSWHSHPAKEESIVDSPFTTKKNKFFIVHCVLYILILFLVLVGSKWYIIKTSKKTTIWIESPASYAQNFLFWRFRPYLGRHGPGLWRRLRRRHPPGSWRLSWHPPGTDTAPPLYCRTWPLEAVRSVVQHSTKTWRDTRRKVRKIRTFFGLSWFSMLVLETPAGVRFPSSLEAERLFGLNKAR